MALTLVTKAKDLRGKRVLVRVDYNVPMKQGKILDDTRLRATVPTIEFLVAEGAIVILLTHIGRPDGHKVRSLSIEPIARALWKVLGHKVHFIPAITGSKAQKALLGLRPGDVALLENVRFIPGEEKNANEVAHALSGLGDIFVQDGFAVAHRASASVVGVAQHLPSYAGLLLDAEMQGLGKVLKKPATPMCVVLGGAKSETKIPVLKNLLPKATNILLGGALFNTYLCAKGYGVGDSLVDAAYAEEAVLYCSKKKVILPIDVVVGERNGRKYRVVEIGKHPYEICKKGESIFDIGPATIALYAGYIKKAKTLVWNGAMGFFEQKPYDIGTLSIARLVAARSKGPAYGVIGGGETLLAMDMVHMSQDIDLVSTGGGAMLEYLSGETLPGIVALEQKKKK